MNNEKFIRKWEKTKRRGKKRYVLTNSIMAGIAPFIGYAIGGLAKVNFFDRYFEYHIYIHFGYFLGGLIGGHVRWQQNEEKYDQLLNVNAPK